MKLYKPQFVVLVILAFFASAELARVSFLPQELVIGAGVKDTNLQANLVTEFNKALEIKSKYVLDEVTLTKTDIKNAELDKYSNEPKDEIKVTLGDNTTGLLGAGVKEFVPDIELKRWNEVSFKIKTGKLLADKKNKAVSFVGDKVKFTTDKMDFEMYDVPATATDDGGYKYVWYLNTKPATNTISFEIESSGLDFFYQPALNVENTDKSLTCTETQCKDKDGNVVIERPENVVGSYAVYHSTKGGMNDINGKEYKVGKAFHIYRPHIIDANGAETWGILHIENGIYSVEIPQEFLDTAVYPIKSNDTFGYTSLGVSSLSQPVNRGLFSNLNTTASGDGVVDSIQVGTLGNGGASLYCKGLIVKVSTSAILADGISPIITISAISGWQIKNYTNKPSVISGETYWAGVVFGSAMSVFRDTSTGVNSLYENDNNYSTPTNPSSLTNSTNKYSIYATYTPSGGGAAAPVQDVIFFD